MENINELKQKFIDAIETICKDYEEKHLPEPSKDKLLALIDELKKFTIIDQKRNLKRLL